MKENLVKKVISQLLVVALIIGLFQVNIPVYACEDTSDISVIDVNFGVLDFSNPRKAQDNGNVYYYRDMYSYRDGNNEVVTIKAIVTFLNPENVNFDATINQGMRLFTPVITNQSIINIEFVNQGTHEPVKLKNFSVLGYDVDATEYHILSGVNEYALAEQGNIGASVNNGIVTFLSDDKLDGDNLNNPKVAYITNYYEPTSFIELTLGSSEKNNNEQFYQRYFYVGFGDQVYLPHSNNTVGSALTYGPHTVNEYTSEPTYNYDENFAADKAAYNYNIATDDQGNYLQGYLNVKHYETIDTTENSVIQDENLGIFSVESYDAYIMQKVNNDYKYAENENGSLYFNVNSMNENDDIEAAYYNAIKMWGYFVPKFAGNYVLGIKSDDGSFGEISVNRTANNYQYETFNSSYKMQSVKDSDVSTDDANLLAGLEEGRIYPVYIEYFENQKSGSSFEVVMKYNGSDEWIPVPTDYWYPAGDDHGFDTIERQPVTITSPSAPGVEYVNSVLLEGTMEPSDSSDMNSVTLVVYDSEENEQYRFSNLLVNENGVWTIATAIDISEDVIGTYKVVAVDDKDSGNVTETTYKKIAEPVVIPEIVNKDVTLGQISVSATSSASALSTSVGQQVDDFVVIAQMQTTNYVDSEANLRNNIADKSKTSLSDLKNDEFITYKNEFDTFIEIHPNGGATNEEVGFMGLQDGRIIDKDNNVIGEAGVAIIDYHDDQGEVKSSDKIDPPEWHRITFDEPLDNPVVIAQLASHFGGEKGHIRIGEVTNEYFDVWIEEWSNRRSSNHHNHELVTFVAIEAGSHEFASGKVIEAKEVSLDEKWNTVDFDNSFDVSTLEVFSQTQSYDDVTQVWMRQDDVTGTSVTLLKYADGISFGTDGSVNGGNSDDTVGYFAVGNIDTSTVPVDGVTIGGDDVEGSGTNKTVTLYVGTGAEQGENTTILTASVSPDEATDKSVNWSADLTDKVIFHGSEVTLSANANAGDTIIVTATTVDGSKTDTVKILAVNKDAVIKIVDTKGNDVEKLEMVKDEVVTLLPNVVPSGANIGPFMWASSDPSKVEVEPIANTENATVKAVAGAVEADKVRVDLYDGNSQVVDSVYVTVTVPVDGVIIVGDDVETVTHGEPSVTEEAVVFFVGDEVSAKDLTTDLDANVSPIDASNPKVTWAIEAGMEAYADVNADTGVVTLKEPSQAGIEFRVIATTEDGVKTDDVAIIVVNVKMIDPVTKTDTTPVELKVGPNALVTEKDLDSKVNPEDVKTGTITWTVANTDVATVDASGNVTAVEEGITKVELRVNGVVVDTETVKVIDTTVDVSAISIADADQTIEFGTGAVDPDEDLDVIVTPEDATNPAVVWSLVLIDEQGNVTQDTSGKAVVDQNGVVTPGPNAQDGDVVIVMVASLDNPTITDTIEMTIVERIASDGLSITPLEVNLEVGTAADTALTTTKLEEIFTPEDAESVPVEWYSEDSAIATVDEDGNVTAIENGTVKIYVATVEKQEDGVTPLHSAFSLITVTRKMTPETIDVSPKENVLEVGTDAVHKSVDLEAILTPDFAVTDNLVWVSSNPEIATVTDEGLVEAVAVGETTIEVYIEGSDPELKAISNIVVKSVVYPLDITVSPITYTLQVGTATGNVKTVDLTETITPADSTYTSVTWSSSDDSVASVDDDGKVTAHKAGTVTITVMIDDTDGDFFATATIKVETKNKSTGGNTTPSTPSTPTTPSTDLGDDEEIAEDLGEDELIAEGLVEFYNPYIKGYPDGQFKGKQAITRIEMAAIMSRILNLDTENAAQHEFSDMKESHWANGYLNSVTEIGLFNGYTDGTFKPNQAMSRAEIAAVISRYWDYTGYEADASGTPLTDISGNWAETEINELYNKGLVTGYTDKSFKPSGQLLREQVVIVVNNLLNRPENEAMVPKFPDVNFDYWAYGDIEAASSYFEKGKGFSDTPFEIQ